MKWGKTKFEVELNLNDKPKVLKLALSQLSGLVYTQDVSIPCLYVYCAGVSPDRQTLMIGGIKIGDEEWGKARDKLKPVCFQLVSFAKSS